MTATECSFECLYRESHDRLPRRVHRMTGRLEDAHDLVQETYARAWQHGAVVSAYDDPEAWLHTVAWRLAVHRSRKLRNGRIALRRLGPAVNLPGPDVDTVVLVAALRELPLHQREALVLHYVAGLPVRGRRREAGRRGRHREGAAVEGTRCSRAPARRTGRKAAGGRLR